MPTSIFKGAPASSQIFCSLYKSDLIKLYLKLVLSDILKRS